MNNCCKNDRRLFENVATETMLLLLRLRLVLFVAESVAPVQSDFICVWQIVGPVYDLCQKNRFLTPVT